MITLKATFDTRTEMGLTTCTAEKVIFSNYRDVDNVDDAVKYVKKLFSAKKYSNQCIDFIYSNNTTYGQTTQRFFCLYSGKVEGVLFREKETYGEKIEVEKLTGKVIKEAYLNCAERALDWEEHNEKANV